ncbi:hypothetical protein LTR85_003095 [Meristemomyces frigidus]|nr:hypothetical protein LTR85_003095 [Meristemomyces frigidus]
MRFFITFVFLFAITTSAAADNDAGVIRDCCTRMGQQLPGLVSYPQSGQYDASNNNRWSGTSVLAPSCIVQVTGADDLSTAIKILTVGVSGRDSACKFAIKSGGHTPYAGANDIDGGISLDLSYLNETTLSADHTYVSLGTGSTWLNAYENLDGTGVAFPGGRCGDAGVGGLTLGGGISFFAPRVGLVADNVINYEVVLASGDIVNANRNTHSDLFMALKGGSSNFGIVTRFDIATFANSGLWGGGIMNPATDDVTSQVLSAMYSFTETNHNDPFASYGTIFTYGNNSNMIINSLVYTEATAHPEIFRGIEAITPQIDNSLRITNMADLTSEGSSFLPRGYRDLMATVTFVNNLAVMQAVQAATLDIYKSVGSVPDMQWIYSYEPVPNLFTQEGTNRGGNMLGLNRTEEDLIVMMLSPRWQSAEYDAAMHAASALGFGSDFFYLSYADSFQNPLSSYASASVDFMKQVARTYDPQQVFQHLVPGGFKISHA